MKKLFIFALLVLISVSGVAQENESHKEAQQVYKKLDSIAQKVKGVDVYINNPRTFFRKRMLIQKIDSTDSLLGMLKSIDKIHSLLLKMDSISYKADINERRNFYKKITKTLNELNVINKKSLKESGGDPQKMGKNGDIAELYNIFYLSHSNDEPFDLGEAAEAYNNLDIKIFEMENFKSFYKMAKEEAEIIIKFIE